MHYSIFYGDDDLMDCDSSGGCDGCGCNHCDCDCSNYQPAGVQEIRYVCVRMFAIIVYMYNHMSVSWF